jgi:chromosome segregation ATPase
MNPARLLEYEGDSSPEPAMDELAQLPGQVATLKLDVDHIKKDVADIKINLKRLEDRLVEGDKGLNAKVEGADKRLSDKIDGVGEQLNGKLDGVDKRLNDKIDAVNKDLKDQIAGVDKGLRDRIDAVYLCLSDRLDALQKELSSAKLWAFALYVAQGSVLLFVMAKGFKWL